MKHPTYYDLIYLMDTRNISFQTLANSLKLSFNEIVDKIIGKDDFTLSEGQQIAILLGESLDVIFFTPLCVDKDTRKHIEKVRYLNHQNLLCFGRLSRLLRKLIDRVDGLII